MTHRGKLTMLWFALGVWLYVRRKAVMVLPGQAKHPPPRCVKLP